MFSFIWMAVGRFVSLACQSLNRVLTPKRQASLLQARRVYERHVGFELLETRRVLDGQLVAEWNFDDVGSPSVRDMSTYNRRLELSGFVSSDWSAPVIGSAREEYSLHLGSPAKFGVASGLGGVAIDAVSLWIKPDEAITKTSEGSVLAEFSNGVQIVFGRASEAVIDEVISLRDPQGRITAVRNVSIPANAWRHVLFLWNSTSSRYDIFVDGQIGDLVHNSNVSRVTAMQMTLGKGTTGSSRPFPGSVDNMKLLTGENRSAEQLYDSAKPFSAEAAIDAVMWNRADNYEQTAAYSWSLADDFIPVDTSRSYRMSGFARSGSANGSSFNPNNYQLFGFASYDIDQQFIGPENVYHFPNSRTTLRHDLKPGDKVIYLDNANGWSTDSLSFTKVLGWYGYTDSTGHTYPNFSYTRNITAEGLWKAEGVNTNDHTIRLEREWNGPLLRAGEAVANHFHSSSFNYLYGGAIPNSWLKYGGVVSGIDTESSVAATKFRPGTAFVKPILLMNYQGTSDNRIQWRDVSWSNETPTAAYAGEKVELDAVGVPLAAGLSYQWTQTAGPVVEVSGSNTQTPSIRVPNLLADADLDFRITVSDGISSIADTLKVHAASPPIDATYSAVLDASTWNTRGSFATKDSYSWMTADELIPVDTSRTYHLSAIGRSGTDDGGDFVQNNYQYFGFASYDIDGKGIGPENAYHFERSRTVLTSDLNPGDRIVYLQDTSGWSSDSTPYTKVLGWYGYTDSRGHTYPNYSYTRNLSAAGLWSPDSVRPNQIALNEPWAGPTLRKGQAVANHFYTSSYNYLYYGAVPNTWISRQATISGVEVGSAADPTKFRVGTAFIKPVVLANYHGSSNNRIEWRDVILSADPVQGAVGGQMIKLHIGGKISGLPGLTNHWVQVSGPAVELENSSSRTAYFTVPRKLKDYELSFRGTVSDGQKNISNVVTIHVPAAEDYDSAEAIAVLDAATWNGMADYSRKEPFGWTVTDDLISVDPTRAYELNGWARSGVDDGGDYSPKNRQYFGFASYDIDRNGIGPEHVYHRRGSRTQLARDLNPGDTVVYLQSVRDWSTDSSAYTKVLGWYGYTDSTGHTYPDYSYTRNVSTPGLWGPDSVNHDNNSIRLNAAWTGPPLRIGQSVANHFYSSSYNYLFYGEVPNTWTNYRATIGGVSDGNESQLRFRPGTAFVKPIVLTNYHGESDNLIQWRDVEWTYARPWQNRQNPFDSNNSGVVTSADVLTVMNCLNEWGVIQLPSINSSHRFCDVNGDDQLTMADLELVQQALSGNATRPHPHFEPDDQFDLKLRMPSFGGDASFQWFQNAGSLVTTTDHQNGIATAQVPRLASTADMSWRVQVSDGHFEISDSTGLSVQAVPIDARYSLAFTDLSGGPITSVPVGQPFLVNAFVEDRRVNPTGPFSAYVDVRYDADLLELRSAPTFSDSFRNGRVSNVEVPGVLDEVGAIRGEVFESSGSGPQLLFTAAFIGKSPGRTVVSSDPADDPDLHPTAFYHENERIDRRRIQFDSSAIEIVSQPALAAPLESAPQGEGEGGVCSGNSSVNARLLIAPTNEITENGGTTSLAITASSCTAKELANPITVNLRFQPASTTNEVEVADLDDEFELYHNNSKVGRSFTFDPKSTYNLVVRGKLDIDATNSKVKITADVSGVATTSNEIILSVVDLPSDATCSLLGTPTNQLLLRASPVALREPAEEGDLLVCGPRSGTYTVTLNYSGDAVRSFPGQPDFNVYLPGPSQLAPTTFTFSPTSGHSKALKVRVHDDSQPESTETAVISATASSSGIQSAQASVAIRDDDNPACKLKLTAVPDSVSEGGSATVEVRLTDIAACDSPPPAVEISWSGSGNGAQKSPADNDYLVSSPYQPIGAFDTKATIPLVNGVGYLQMNVLEDPVYEDLSRVTFQVSGSPLFAVVKILDDDKRLEISGSGSSPEPDVLFCPSDTSPALVQITFVDGWTSGDLFVTLAEENLNPEGDYSIIAKRPGANGQDHIYALDRLPAGIVVHVDENLAPGTSIKLEVRATKDSIETDSDLLTFSLPAPFDTDGDGIGYGPVGSNSAEVSLTDAPEQVSLKADPKTTKEHSGPNGAFIISADKPICSQFQFDIDETVPNSATLGVDYTLSLPATIETTSQRLEVTESSAGHLTIDAWNVTSVTIGVVPIDDDVIEEPAEVVRATLSTPYSPVTAAEVLIQDEYVDGQIESDQKPDPDAECGCSCVVCPGEGIVLLGQDGAFRLSSHDRLLTYHSDGTHNLHPVLRVELPSVGTDKPDTISVTLNALISSDETISSNERSVVAGPFVYAVDEKAYSPGPIRFAIQADLSRIVNASDSLDSVSLELVVHTQYASPRPTQETRFSGWIGRTSHNVRNPGGSTLSEPAATDSTSGSLIAPAESNVRTIPPGFTFPFLKRLVVESPQFPSQELFVFVPDFETPSPLDVKKEYGVALFRGDNSSSWYRRNGSAYIRPAESLSDLVRTGEGFELRHRYGDPDVFDSTGLHIKHVDRNGNETRFGYSNGQLTSITDVYQRVTAISYQDGGRIEIVEYTGQLTVYQYTENINGATLTITYPDPDLQADGPDSDNLPDNGPHGSLVETFAYDEAGFLTDVTRSGIGEAAARSMSFTYNRTFDLRVVTVSATDAGTWTFKKHRQQEGHPGLFYSGGIIAGDHPAAIRTEFSDIAELTDGRGNTTRFKLDHRGRVLETTDAIQRDLLDRFPEALAQADRKFIYERKKPERDSFGRFIRDRGEILRITTPDPDDFRYRENFGGTEMNNGERTPQVTTQSFDINSNLMSRTFPMSLTESWQYGSMNQVTRHTDIAGNPVIYELDTLTGDVLATVWPQSGTDSVSWQNPRNRFDVNQDGASVPLDALILINDLNERGARSLSSERPSSGAYYLDVSGSKSVEPLDALQLINHINEPSTTSGFTDRGMSRIDLYYTRNTGIDPWTNSVRPMAGIIPNGLITAQVTATGRGIPSVVEYEYFDRDSNGAPVEVSKRGQLRRVTRSRDLPEQSIQEFDYDPQGNVSSILHENGQRSEYFYDRLNRLVLSIGIDPDGTGDSQPPVQRTDYDPFGNVIASEVINHNPLTGQFTVHTECFTYDGMDRLTQVTESASNISTVINADERIRRMSRLGRFERIQCTGDSSAFQVTSQFQYDLNGNLIRSTDANGHAVAYEYDALNRMTRMIEPSLDSSSDKSGNPILNGDALLGELDGPITQLRYDNLGNLWSVVDAFQNESHFRYDDLNRLTVAIGPKPESVMAAGDLRPDRGTSELINMRGIAAVTSYTYEVHGTGWKTTVSDPLGRSTEYYSDFLDRTTKTVAPANSVGQRPTTTYEYFADGLLRETTDPRGNRTNYHYDARGRLIHSLQPESPSGSRPKTSYQYSVDSHLTAITDPLNRTQTFEYDLAGRRHKITWPDPESGTAGEGLGDKMAPSKTYAYDAVGNILTETDRLGRTSRSEYDGRFQIVRQVNANNGVTSFAYDPSGNPTAMVDPGGNVTTWTYNQRNQVTRETQENIGTRSFIYDAVGNLTRKVDRNSRVVTYQYDRLYRPIRENWFASDVDTTSDHEIRFTFDLAGQVRTASDVTSTTSWEYDQLGLPILETQFVDSLKMPVRLMNEFDTNGNRTKQTTSLGGMANDGTLSAGTIDTSTEFRFDRLNRLTDVTQRGPNSGSNVVPKHITFTFDDANQLRTIARFEGLTNDPGRQVAVTTLGYDQAGRMTTLAHTRTPLDPAAIDNTGKLVLVPNEHELLAGYRYDWDGANQLLSVENLRFGSESVRYSFDRRGQLTETEYPSEGKRETFSYDENGNRTEANAMTATTPAASHNRLQSDGIYNYEYDREGNRTSRTRVTDGTVTTYEWDHRNRLTRVTEKGIGGTVTKSVQYGYDPMDRRITELVDMDGAGEGNAFREYVIYDGPFPIMRFRDSDVDGPRPAQLTHRYLFGVPGMILAEEQLTAGTAGSSISNVMWPLVDHLGTVRDVVDYSDSSNSASIVNHITYDSFGNVVQETAPSVDVLFGFAGLELDAETGLSHSRTRYYDPVVGRWTQEDWIGFAGGDQNLSRYASNSPSIVRDPTGEYGIGGHFWTTYIVAVSAGYKPEEAFRLAYYAQLPDQCREFAAKETWARDWRTGGKEFNAQYDLVFDFLHSLLRDVSTRRKQLMVFIGQNRRVLSEWELGFLLHAFGDSYAHSYRFGSANQFERGYPAPNGHMRAGTKPDLIANDLAKYKAHVSDLYSALGGSGQACDHPTIAKLFGFIERLPDDFRDEAKLMELFAREHIGYDYFYIPTDDYNQIPDSNQLPLPTMTDLQSLRDKFRKQKNGR